MFVKTENRDVEDIGQGVKRKILAYSGSLMSVEVHFKKGAIGVAHSHVHEQITYVLEGQFEVQVGQKKELLGKGDMFYAGPNIEHGVVALEDGVLLDTFAPQRDDFL
ncbi:MAG: cupin domain-containing protein [Spirochaetales bacterium]|nr:cupin domain-containing protein [Spirochaetales bacterium]